MRKRSQEANNSYFGQNLPLLSGRPKFFALIPSHFSKVGLKGVGGTYSLDFDLSRAAFVAVNSSVSAPNLAVGFGYGVWDSKFKSKGYALFYDIISE